MANAKKTIILTNGTEIAENPDYINFVGASAERDSSGGVTINGGHTIGGYRTVLFGDSMTETQYTINVPSAASYNTSTGVLTLTSNSHAIATGWRGRIINRSYTSLLKGEYYSLTRVDANTLTAQLEANLPGLPNGALTGTTQVRMDAWQSAQGFVTWFQGYNGWRFNIVFNGAQSGDTTQNALDRLQEDCLAYEPNVVIMQMPGINDLSSGNGPVAEETIWDNQQLLIDRIVNSGAHLILLTVTPVATGEAAGRATLQKMQSVMRLNRRLKAYCQGLRAVTIFDAWRYIVDPTNTTGLAAASTYLRNSTDSIHYSMRGGERIGRLLWTQIANSFPADYSTLPASQVDSYSGSAVSLTSVSRTSNVVTATSTAHGFTTGDYAKVYGGSGEFLNAWVTVTVTDANTLTFPSVGSNGAIAGTITLGRNNNLFANPLLTALDGAIVAPITGTEATDSASLLKIQEISGSITGVASIVARADGYGNNQRFVVTAGAASDQCDIELDFTPATDTVVKHTLAGRQYVAEAELSLTNVSGSNLSEVRWNIQSVIGGVTYQWYALNGYSDGANLNTNISGLHIKTPPMTMPTGTCTNIKFMLVLTFSAAGTALTVDLGRIALREIDGASA